MGRQLSTYLFDLGTDGWQNTNSGWVKEFKLPGVRISDTGRTRIFILPMDENQPDFSDANIINHTLGAGIVTVRVNKVPTGQVAVCFEYK